MIRLATSSHDHYHIYAFIKTYKPLKVDQKLSGYYSDVVDKPQNT